MNDKLTKFYNLIGKNIKRIRKEHGDTQEKLAEKIGMSRTFISYLESKETDVGVSFDTIFLIAEVYKIHINEFFIGYEDYFEIEK